MSMLRVVLLALLGAGIMVLVTAAFIPFSSRSVARGDSIPVMVTTESEQAKVPESVNDFYPVISERYGQNPIVKNGEDASQAVGFTVKFPRIDLDYKLQLAAIEPVPNGSDYVWLFYSKNAIADDMTFNQFWENGGITINYHENMTLVHNDDGSTNISYSNLTTLFVDVKEYGLDAYETEISGHPAVAIADLHREFKGFAIHDPTQVDFIAGNTYVSLQGYKDTNELIRMAETMPF
jgi:hypothetical protein